MRQNAKADDRDRKLGSAIGWDQSVETSMDSWAWAYGMLLMQKSCEFKRRCRLRRALKEAFGWLRMAIIVREIPGTEPRSVCSVRITFSAFCFLSSWERLMLGLSIDY